MVTCDFSQVINIFGHNNIIRYCNRPFGDIEEMEYQLIERFNALVDVDDEVWHLGDFSMNPKYVKPILSRLKGRHFLIAGNHDRCYSRHSKSHKYVSPAEYISYGFKEVGEQRVLSIDGYGPVQLNHMPYHGDHSVQERYSNHRPPDNGLWLLHGHIHQKWKVLDKMINVGVDVWDFKPVSEHQIRELLITGKEPG